MHDKPIKTPETPGLVFKKRFVFLNPARCPSCRSTTSIKALRNKDGSRAGHLNQFTHNELHIFTRDRVS